jgi:hypothetical protein
LYEPSDGVLVIDAGTSAMRAVHVGRDGATSTVASAPWRIFKPDDASDFGRELEASEIAASLDSLLRAAEGRGRPAAIALTGQREGVAFLDERDSALFVSPNIDGRAASEGMAIDLACGERVYAVTGHLPALMQAPAKLAWLRANRPKVAIGPGNYTLDENVRLIMAGKPVAGRRTSDVEIRFWAADPKAEPPGPPYKIQVPDGFGTWAITCRPRTGILWVLTSGALRKIDYRNPAGVKETSITRGSSDDMPDEFREAVKRILTISNVPAEQITALLAGSAPD